MLNNLGGTPTMELYICARRAIAQLRALGASVVRAFVGPFMTSLEMQGVSLSVLQVRTTLTLCVCLRARVCVYDFRRGKGGGGGRPIPTPQCYWRRRWIR